MGVGSVFPYGHLFLRDGNNDGIFNIYDEKDLAYDHNGQKLTTSQAIQADFSLKEPLVLFDQDGVALRSQLRQQGFVMGYMAGPPSAQTNQSSGLKGRMGPIALVSVAVAGAWWIFGRETEMGPVNPNIQAFPVTYPLGPTVEGPWRGLPQVTENLEQEAQEGLTEDFIIYSSTDAEEDEEVTGDDDDSTLGKIEKLLAIAENYGKIEDLDKQLEALEAIERIYAGLDWSLPRHALPYSELLILIDIVKLQIHGLAIADELNAKYEASLENVRILEIIGDLYEKNRNFAEASRCHSKIATALADSRASLEDRKKAVLKFLELDGNELEENGFTNKDMPEVEEILSESEHLWFVKSALRALQDRDALDVLKKVVERLNLMAIKASEGNVEIDFMSEFSTPSYLVEIGNLIDDFDPVVSQEIRDGNLGGRTLSQVFRDLSQEVQRMVDALEADLAEEPGAGSSIIDRDW